MYISDQTRVEQASLAAGAGRERHHETAGGDAEAEVWGIAAQEEAHAKGMCRRSSLIG